MQDSIASSLEALNGANYVDTVAKRAHYAPPWADVSIIGIAGSSGSGKSTLSHAIVRKLNLPWVVILSIVSRRCHVVLHMAVSHPARTRFTRASTRKPPRRLSGTNTTLTPQR